MSEEKYISVILPLKLEWEPCYSMPVTDNESCGTDIKIGERVRVNFANKEYIGVVSGTGIEPATDKSKVKPVISVEKGMAAVLSEEIALWRKVAGYYLCSIGEVYKAAYPIGKVSLEEAQAAARLKAEQRRQSREQSARAALETKLARLRCRMEKKMQMAERARREDTRETYLSEAEALRSEICKAESELEACSGGHIVPENTYGQIQLEVRPREQAEQGEQAEQPLIKLSEAQTKAYEEIKDGFRKGVPVLLHGVTGSGKTEIYTKLAQETIANGRNVLYLVPEIALSRQLEYRLEAYFGERLLVFHSGETSASRRDTAGQIRALGRNGSSYIVLGTRSALFLPHHDLGLIIVDEEHDNSYKQDSPAPRYNGRDTALMLSALQNEDRNDEDRCCIILGSATPSFEELYNCKTGRHKAVRLSERYHGSDNASIEIIDTGAERRKRGMVGSFSRKLIDHIRKTINDGGQVIILRSRRAWAPAMQCDSCGEIVRCPHCHVSMSWHNPQRASDIVEQPSSGAAQSAVRTIGKAIHSSDRAICKPPHIGGKMVCHSCGCTITATGHCPKCSGTLSPLGAGTQKIEEEAAVLFPDARIARLDSDTAQKRNYEEQIIKEFGSGEIDILIGTQIVTKGFDFSNLTLVAVIAADSLLGMQDFRADEKAIQLLEQFRGRCGRRERKGMFVIQTSQPDHPVYRQLLQGETETFSDVLLQERKDFSFPPYSRIVVVTVKDKYEDRAAKMAAKLAEELRQALCGTVSTAACGGSATLTGPYPPPVDKIADQYIRTIRINLRKDRNLASGKAALLKTVTDFEKRNKYPGHIIIDVDPS